MLPVKNIDDVICREINELSKDEKMELLRYIESLKLKEADKAVEMLERTAGAWKGLIDSGELKKNIYADRLITTRPGVSL